MEPLKPDESSPLDDPFNRNYVRVILIEVVVILCLFILGQLFQ